MTIKEKPLIDAVSKLGPLPGFLFSNPVVAGFISIIMCAVFGGVFVMFWSLFGGGDAVYLFEAARWGSIIGVGVGALIHLGIFVSAFFQRDEAANRIQFVLGGVLGVALLALLDILFLESIRAWLPSLGRIV